MILYWKEYGNQNEPNDTESPTKALSRFTANLQKDFLQLTGTLKSSEQI